MPIQINNFAQLNQYLEKAEDKLRSRPERESAIREKIEKIIKENLEVVTSEDFDQVGRFLRSVKQISIPGSGEGLVQMAIHAVASTSGSLNLDEIHQFKELDEGLYYESLANHISTNLISINSLGFSLEEMIKVMPWVTFLVLEGDVTGIGESIPVTDELLERLIENAPNLESLSIAQCPNLKGTFFSHFENLQATQSLNVLQNLKSLRIEGCHNFNQSLNGLKNLEQLIIDECDTFNGSLDGLQHLWEFGILDCRNFNQSLKGLQNLRQLVISGCPSFEIKDAQTGYLILNLMPVSINVFLQSNSPEATLQCSDSLIQILEEKTKIFEEITPEIGGYLFLFVNLKHSSQSKLMEFAARIPLLRVLLFSFFQERAVMRGADPEGVIGQYRELKGLPDYLAYLKITVHAFPRLTSFLVRELKEEILPYFENLSASDQLPFDYRLPFLPLFPPEQIWKLISAVPLEIKLKWLEKEIRVDQFSGSIRDVLNEITQDIIECTDPQEQIDLISDFKELIVQIPFNTLAFLASVASQSILSFSFLMDDASLASVVPLLPDEVFSSYLMNHPMPTHLQYLFYATTRQKEAYISDDVLKDPESLLEWDQNRTQIEELISRFENNKTKERFQVLEDAWREIVNKTHNEVQAYEKMGEALQGKLLRFSPNQDYENKVISYLEPKTKRAAEVLHSLKMIGDKIEMLEGKVLGYIETPKEFIDTITTEIMVDPYHHPIAPNYIYDLSTWKRVSIHPATGLPFKLEDLIPDTELQAKIEAFRKQAS